MNHPERSIIEAIKEGNAEKLETLLSQYKIGDNNNKVPAIDTEIKDATFGALMCASAMPPQDGKQAPIEKILIERTAMMINLFTFLQLVAKEAGIKEYSELNKLPQRICDVIAEQEFDKKTAQKIEKLDSKPLKALIAFLISTDVKKIDTRFNQSILKCIYKNGTLVSGKEMLSYMALSLRQTDREAIDKIEEIVYLTKHRRPCGSHCDQQSGN